MDRVITIVVLLAILIALPFAYMGVDALVSGGLEQQSFFATTAAPTTTASVEAQDRERFESFTKADFAAFVDDDNLLHAAISWAFGAVAADSSNYKQAFKALPYSCQVVVTVIAVAGEIDNGGFNQYYYNQTNVEPVDPAVAMEEIGANEVADILRQADALFAETYNQQLHSEDGYTIEEFFDSYEGNPLNDLDDPFYAARDNCGIDTLLNQYIRQHIQDFGY